MGYIARIGGYMEKRRLLLIVGLPVLLIGLLVISLVVFNQSESPETTEVEGPGTVVVDNSDELRNTLLPDQYSSVLEEVIAFIRAKIDANAEHAVITDKLKIERNGSLSFVVKVDGPSQPFRVSLDRSKFDKITLRIPTHQHTKVLDIY
jgi:hypothetical protein